MKRFLLFLIVSVLFIGCDTAGTNESEVVKCTDIKVIEWNAISFGPDENDKKVRMALVNNTKHIIQLKGQSLTYTVEGEGEKGKNIVLTFPISDREIKVGPDDIFGHWNEVPKIKVEKGNISKLFDEDNESGDASVVHISEYNTSCKKD